jgi:ureidoacrylate peracid hydrolase
VIAPSEDLLATLDQKVARGNAAVLVIDVQNDFVADGGFFHRIGADVGRIQQAIGPLSRFLDAAREAGVLVVFIQAIYDPQHLSPAMRERNLRRGIEMPRCITGSWGADFNVVGPRADEQVVIKHRYSAFTNPQLGELLRRHGIRSLLLTGVSTDTCVESTGRDFYFADYYVTMVSDCCAAASERDHLGALERFDRDYGAVAASGEIIAAWQRASLSSTHPVGTLAHG